MTNMTLFQNNPLVSSELFQALKDMNRTLAGTPAMRRLSFRGKKFRMMMGGEQVAIAKGDELNVVILDAAPVHRTYYEGTYSPDDVKAPTCWSVDTKVPAPEVPADQRQASRCDECPMNIKGSGQGETRACRFAQRLAVTLEGEPDIVYQAQIAATSIFGSPVNGNMPLQAYARFMDAHNTPVIAVMTQIYFDDNADVPKVFFKPVRPLTEEELKGALEARQSEDAKRAVTFTVAQTDGVEGKARAAAGGAGAAAQKAAKPAASKPTAAQVAGRDADDVVDEPRKVSKPTPAAPAPAMDLAAVISAWED